MYRYKDDVEVNSNSNTKFQDNEFQRLGEIIIKKDKYYYNPIKKGLNSNFTDLTNLSWLVYKGNKIPNRNRQYKISEGDVLKIGRIWLIVKEIKINKKEPIDEKIIFYNSYNQDLKEESLNFKNNLSEITNQSRLQLKIKKKAGQIKTSLYKPQILDDIKLVSPSVITKSSTRKNKKIPIRKSASDVHKAKVRPKPKPICRICYVEEEEGVNGENNPLIQPCSCSGSMKYIHLKCLRHWLSSKIIVKAHSYSPIDYCTTYSINQVQCELCKEKLPDFIRHKGQLYNLLEFSTTTSDKENYIVFDTISPDKGNNRFRYFVKFDSNNNIKIGRGLEVQLMLTDISVSRVHTVLTLINDDYVIMEDFNSKFGSLVLLQCPSVEILNGQTLTVQTGRTYMNIELKQPFQLFNCCGVNDYDRTKSYDKINRKYVHFETITYIKEDNPNEEEEDNEEEEEKASDQNMEEEKEKSIDSNEPKITGMSKGNGFLKVIEEEVKAETPTRDKILMNTKMRKKTGFGDSMVNCIERLNEN